MAQPTCGMLNDEGKELCASSIRVFSLTPGSCMLLVVFHGHMDGI